MNSTTTVDPPSTLQPLSLCILLKCVWHEQNLTFRHSQPTTFTGERWKHCKEIKNGNWRLPQPHNCCEAYGSERPNSSSKYLVVVRVVVQHDRLKAQYYLSYVRHSRFPQFLICSIPSTENAQTDFSIRVQIRIQPVRKMRVVLNFGWYIGVVWWQKQVESKKIVHVRSALSSNNDYAHQVCTVFIGKNVDPITVQIFEAFPLLYYPLTPKCLLFRRK
mmetsp:Transcript_9498/g.25766  ORF Transcript_9498/g.25766 Transcript_9498/m.25766 type:complete len:218 (-) Transcript_9498:653-1306(-)